MHQCFGCIISRINVYIGCHDCWIAWLQTASGGDEVLGLRPRGSGGLGQLEAAWGGLGWHWVEDRGSGGLGQPVRPGAPPPPGGRAALGRLGPPPHRGGLRRPETACGCLWRAVAPGVGPHRRGLWQAVAACGGLWQPVAA